MCFGITQICWELSSLWDSFLPMYGVHCLTALTGFADFCHLQDTMCD